MTEIKLKIYNDKPELSKIGYVSLEDFEGEPHLVVVDEDGEVIVYLAKISPDGLHLCSYAKNEFIATTIGDEYAVIKRDD